MYYIYILNSEKANRYYIGYSEDPINRLAQHNTNDTKKFTGKSKDWKLCAVFSVGNLKKEAIKAERFIKRQKSRHFIEKLINKTFKPDGELAQLVRVPHVRDSPGSKKTQTLVCVFL